MAIQVTVSQHAVALQSFYWKDKFLLASKVLSLKKWNKHLTVLKLVQILTLRQHPHLYTRKPNQNKANHSTFIKIKIITHSECFKLWKKKKRTKIPPKSSNKWWEYFKITESEKTTWSYFVTISFSFPRIVQSLKELFQQLENFKPEYILCIQKWYCWHTVFEVALSKNQIYFIFNSYFLLPWGWLLH